MIRIDSIWLATQPMDMRAGTDTALARVVAVFGAAKPHCAYLFANRRANRMKVLVHESFFQLLKRERIKRKIYTTRQDARGDVFDYIEMFYNPKRRHSFNNQLTPVEFEKRYAASLESV
ncbi:Transposase (plasmid) [Pseudomonas antarctica]|uniref:Transposase n=2 Tax=Pseudomonas antarctica TaxID=219572 RepID=A0A172Z9Y4_9PSED|nr:IS66 family insertion sequence element accessory protein TnpB [Pseudomonas antarctica]ANF89314.1 Transposase [Pseudomonas antarctica]